MKPSAILREAAQRIEQGRSLGGCSAISNVGKRLWDRSVARKYFLLMAPSNPRALWFGKTIIPANQDRRVIALCFAAAIAESEGQ